MPQDNFFVFCEGIGCLLKENCLRYTSAKRIDRDASGYVWISSCDEDERNMYMPLAKVCKGNFEK